MKWERVGTGRHRDVWRRGQSNYVVKVPLNEAGLHDNWREAELYKRSLKEDLYCSYARCRLLGGLLVMEYACYPGPGAIGGYLPMGACPEWAFSIDCWQVGYNRAGKIVAYDYGY